MTNESITNEWAEFLAYTEAPTYAVKNKKDNGSLGRFTMDMLMENYGFARILTVLARGISFTIRTEHQKTVTRMNAPTMPTALSAHGAVFLTKRMPRRAGQNGFSGASRCVSRASGRKRLWVVYPPPARHRGFHKCQLRQSEQDHTQACRQHRKTGGCLAEKGHPVQNPNLFGRNER